jgi:hypothetical protein
MEVAMEAMVVTAMVVMVATAIMAIIYGYGGGYGYGGNYERDWSTYEA